MMLLPGGQVASSLSSYVNGKKKKELKMKTWQKSSITFYIIPWHRSGDFPLEAKENQILDRNVASLPIPNNLHNIL